MKTRANVIQNALAILLFCGATATPALAADAPRFRPASDVQPGIGRYLVALATDDSVDGGLTSDVLARTYGGRLEPFAGGSHAGPMIMMIMRPAQARALSDDPRVLWVEERPVELAQKQPQPPTSTQKPPVVSSPSVGKRPRSNWDASANSWSSGTYEYDDAGNIERTGADVYRYDKFGRLAKTTAGTTPLGDEAPSPVNEQNFTYDRYGNLATLETYTKPISPSTQRTVENTVFAVNPETNQLNRAGGCAGNVTCLSALYDTLGSGNVTGISGLDQFKWDGLGMLTELRYVRNERYVYDADDERILTIDLESMSSSAEKVRHYTLRAPDHKVLRELTHTLSTNTWLPATDYAYSGEVLMASFSSGSAEDPDRHFHTDHLGSTRVVSDGAGQRLAAHTYWAFGGEADGSETDTERIKFTGHERDGQQSHFKLDYMHARYYDANFGRFLSVDPLLGYPSQPQLWNRYSYVRNNPVNYIDPTGMADCPTGTKEGVDCFSFTIPDPGPSFSMNGFLSGGGTTRQMDRRSTAQPSPSIGKQLGQSFTAFGEGLLTGNMYGGPWADAGYYDPEEMGIAQGSGYAIHGTVEGALLAVGAGEVKALSDTATFAAMRWLNQGRWWRVGPTTLYGWRYAAVRGKLIDKAASAYFKSDVKNYHYFLWAIGPVTRAPIRP